MKRKILIALSGLGMLAPVSSVWGYGAGTWAGIDSDGGLNVDTSSSYSQDGYGTQQALATLDGASYTPELHAFASYTPGNDDGASALASAFQIFTYTGDAATTLTLNLQLDSIVTGDAYARGKTYVVGGSTLDVIDNSNPNSFDSCYDHGKFSAYYAYAIEADLCGQTLDYTDQMWNFGDTDLVMDTLTFDVDVGASFLVYSELFTVAFDGTADAYNTFSMDFTDDSYLVAEYSGHNSVPEPGMLWLMGTGMVGMVGLRRRNKQA